MASQLSMMEEDLRDLKVMVQFLLEKLPEETLTLNVRELAEYTPRILIVSHNDIKGTVTISVEDDPEPRTWVEGPRTRIELVHA